MAKLPPECSLLHLILDRIATKWTVLVMEALLKQPLRFNELRRLVAGISQKMLSQTLKTLERDGLVARKVTPTVPITVEYSVTPLGKTLSATVEALQHWADRHIGDVQAARAAYDSSKARTLDHL